MKNTMKKPHIDSDFTNNAPDNGDGPSDEEVTVKKISPLSAAEEIEDDNHADAELDYKLLYEASLEELKAAKEDSLRKLAEMENFRKRLSKEKDDFIKFAGEGILQELLPCLDNLDMSLTHATPEQLANDPVISGVSLVRKQFLQSLQKFGLEEVGGENQQFDPNLHEAIATQPAVGVSSGTVLIVHRKGYKLAGRLLRAAMVTVSA